MNAAGARCDPPQLQPRGAEAPDAEQAAMIAYVDRMMTTRRGFRQFAAFDAFLLGLYRLRAARQTAESNFAAHAQFF